MGGEAVHLINDLLSFQEDEDGGFFNKPRLFVSRDCRNVIFALQNWTSHDGNKGACKDPVDCLRAMACAELEYVERVAPARPRARGYW